MDINIKELENKRDTLEKRYNEIEDMICKYLLEENDNTKKVKVLEEEEIVIDKQLALLDRIIDNLKSTPLLYEEYEKLSDDYKKVVGD